MTTRMMKTLMIAGVLAATAWGGRAIADEPAPPLEVLWSEPPNGFVDCREDRNAAGDPRGIRTVHVVFNRAVVLEPASVQVAASGGIVPQVEAVDGEGATWTITLDRPIPAGETTALAFGRGQGVLLFRSRPGDVNGDAVSNVEDLRALDHAVRSPTSGVTPFDIDRDGRVSEEDAVRLRSLLEGGVDVAGWSGTEFDDATHSCCCRNGYCVVYVGQPCPGSFTAVPCPCFPNPCPSPGDGP